MKSFVFVLIVGISSVCSAPPTKYLPPKVDKPQQNTHTSNGQEKFQTPNEQQNLHVPNRQQTIQKTNLNKDSSSNGLTQNNKVLQEVIPQEINEALQVPILKLISENDGNGNYKYAYETGDGTSAEETGQVNGESISAQGSFSFIAPDGNQYSISYVADENGFQPQGDHLPTSPPIPEEILKALEQNAADEANGIIDDGKYKSEDDSENLATQQKAPIEYNKENNGYKY